MTLIKKNSQNTNNLPGFDTVNNANIGANKNEVYDKVQRGYY